MKKIRDRLTELKLRLKIPEYIGEEFLLESARKNNFSS